jgi:hypothetical protein
VILSPSGIVDITRRTLINKLLSKQEGEYVKNLERPVKVTHLLCSGDEKTDKMRYAEKFNSRGEANIRLVWEEWFWDSIEFGGESIHYRNLPFLYVSQAALMKRNMKFGILGLNASQFQKVGAGQGL